MGSSKFELGGDLVVREPRGRGGNVFSPYGAGRVCLEKQM